MKLVEADAEGPSGEEPIVTPPRPEKRRVSISLLFTLSVLIATVVSIYVVFPARNNELVTEALARHAEPPAWELTAPSDAELRAWVLAKVGKGAPLPDGLAAIGAASIEVARRPTALVRYQVPGGEFTYVLQPVHSASPRTTERTDDGLRAALWREGKWLVVGVGKDGEAGWVEAAKRRAAK